MTRPGESHIPPVAEAMDWNRYIRQNCHRNLRLSDLALEYQVSPESLRCRIRRKTGMSFKRLYLEAKMDRAARLMRMNSGLPIRSIADLVGIEDPFYFSRLFRKYMGQSPSVYRNRIERSAPGS